MGFLLLFLAALAAAVKGWAGKKTSRVVHQMPDVLFSNALRMLLCLLVGCGLALIVSRRGLRVGRDTLYCALLYAAMLATNVVIWLLCAQGSGYLLISVFGMMGTAVSLLCSALFLHDVIRPAQVPGVLLLIAASGVMCLRRGGLRLKARDLALLLADTLTTGLVDFSQKLFADLHTGDTTAAYSFYCYLFAAVFLLGGYLAVCRARQTSFQPAAIRRAFPFTCVMAATLFINNYARTAAAGMLSAALFYPVYKGVDIILGVLMAALALREKPDARTLCGVGMAFAALLILRAL